MKIDVEVSTNRYPNNYEEENLPRVLVEIRFKNCGNFNRRKAIMLADEIKNFIVKKSHKNGLATDYLEHEQIMQKILKVENCKDFLFRSLRAKICPKCGKSLQRSINKDSLRIHGVEVYYKCISCDFIHETDSQDEADIFSI